MTIWPGASLPIKIISALKNKVRPPTDVNDSKSDATVIADMVERLSETQPGSTAEALATLRQRFPHHPLRIRLAAAAALLRSPKA